MFEFVQAIMVIAIVMASPFLVIADMAGWEALFGEDEEFEKTKDIITTH